MFQKVINFFQNQTDSTEISSSESPSPPSEPVSRAADVLALIVIILMAIGTVFVFSASANVSSDIDLRHFYRFSGLRQIIFFPIAVVILLAFSRINYRFFSLDKGPYKSPVVFFLVISAVLVFLVLTQRIIPFLPTLIPKVNQHYRWFKIPAGPVTMSFQPSELAKWATVFFLAAALVKYSDTLHLLKQRFLPICGAIAVVAGLIITEDFGTAAFICLLSFIMLAIGGAKWKHLLAPLPFAIAVFILILFLYPQRMQRITSFLHPGDLADSSNYQASQSLIAVGSGGIFGRGLGKGICKYGHLPEDTTDFIFAIIGEEMGFVGSASVILLFIIFIILGMYIVRQCNEPFGKLLAAGIVLTIAMQAAINIGVVTVVLPTKGLPLPFVSAGGTSMLLSAAAVGILLNIARQSSKIPIAVSTDSLQDDTVQSPSSPAIQTPPPPLHRRHRRHPTTQDNSEFTPGKTSEGQ